MTRRAAAALLLVLLSACRAPPGPGRHGPSPVRVAPPGTPAAVSTVRYSLDAVHSEVLILVYREGALAALGHNHVLEVRELRGELTWSSAAAACAFWLEFPVAAFAIDAPERRAQAGADFPGTVDPAAIAGTRDHLLGESQLDAAHYPTIRLESAGLQPEGDHWVAAVRIRVRDHIDEERITVQITDDGAEVLASGEFDLNQAALGLTPYSVGLGALRVAQTLHVRYRLAGRRQDSRLGGEQQ